MLNRVAFVALGEWSGWVASANQRAMCKKPQKKETLTLSRDDSAIFGPSSDASGIGIVGRGEERTCWIGQSFCRRLLPMLPPFRHESRGWDQNETKLGSHSRESTSSMKRNEATEKHAPMDDSIPSSFPPIYSALSPFRPIHARAVSLLENEDTWTVFRKSMLSPKDKKGAIMASFAVNVQTLRRDGRFRCSLYQSSRRDTLWRRSRSTSSPPRRFCLLACFHAASECTAGRASVSNLHSSTSTFNERSPSSSSSPHSRMELAEQTGQTLQLLQVTSPPLFPVIVNENMLRLRM